MKRIIVGILLIILASPAFSGVLDDAFQNLAQSQGGAAATVGAGSFRTKTQIGVTFGGSSIRYPNKKLKLMTIDPPRLSMGCNGIDAHLGGFSFISGQQLVEDLKLIAKGVPALLYQMALKAIAAPIVSAIRNLEAKLQKITAGLNDSCRASAAMVGALNSMTGGAISGTANVLSNTSKNAVSEAVSLPGKAAGWIKNRFSSAFPNASVPGPIKSVMQNDCAMTLMSFGLFSDMNAASNRSCGGTKAENTAPSALYKAAKNKGKQALLKVSDKQGNIVWNVLQAAGVAPSEVNQNTNLGFLGTKKFAELIMSMTGTRIFPTDSKMEDGKGGNKDIKVSPGEASAPAIKSVLSASDFLNIFMCGTNYTYDATPLGDNSAGAVSNKDWANRWCSEQLGDPSAVAADGGLIYMQCQGGGSDITAWMHGCLTIDKAPISSLKLGDGMLFATMKLLTSMVEEARTGTPFSAQERSLMTIAPFPLYKVINVAAAAPNIAQSMLKANALTLAFYFAGATINGVLNDMHRLFSASDLPNVPTSLISLLRGAAGKLKATSAIKVQKIMLFKNTADILMANVKTINKNVLAASMAMGMNGSLFTGALSNKIAGQ